MDSRGAGREVPRWSDLGPFLKRHAASFFAGDPFASPLISMTATDMPLAPLRRAPNRPGTLTMPVILPARSADTRSLRVDPIQAPRMASTPAFDRANRGPYRPG
jgi:hypothetical protein